MSIARFLSMPFLMIVLSLNCLAQKRGEARPLFRFLSPQETGVTFANMVVEDDTFNVNEFIYAYNGGGVAVGDVDGDGLPDLYFSGTQPSSPNRLYLNKGNFRFEDVSRRAGVDDSVGVRYGVVMVDVDGDGRLDLYVSKHDAPNTLYINNGDGTFTERARQFGLDFCCHSTQAAFFDYDRDGDLDLYLGVNGEAKGENFKRDGDPDRLFRNNGDGTFTDVSREAGIGDKGYALSISVGDVNDDGWPDIYIANDFEARDILYINNGDGTFSNRLTDAMKHTSIFSMGSDVADFNNDGTLDIMSVDMLPEDHWRKMSHMGTVSPYDPKFDSVQLMRNMLQMNRGDGTFSEVGQVAGISETDWSWAPLFADFDNDGNKDLFISNGYKRDVQNLDVIYNLASRSFPAINMIRKVPSIKLQNYIFRNNGDLTFTKMSDEWGFTQLVNSNGAVYADLDNDGDLDIVVNNIDSTAFIYRNDAVENGSTAHYVDIELRGSGRNTSGIGARVTVVDGARRQMQEFSATRGYLSSINRPLHFGLGTTASVDSVIVSWPDGEVQVTTSVPVDKKIVMQQSGGGVKSADGGRGAGHRSVASARTLFAETTGKNGLDFHHVENRYDDFLHERLLPNRLSRNGPGIAVGDVDGDGRDDIYVGGAKGASGELFLQVEPGAFGRSASDTVFAADSLCEDLGAILFDADNDGDLDLYVVSGGNEMVSTGSDYFAVDSLLYDRLYLNDGHGQFSRSSGLIPQLATSGSCVTAADYDGDGDLDLFVGGRTVPGKYPTVPHSAILRNDGGRFIDATESVAPALARVGMVTSMVWTDYDGDGDLDMIVVGEWMTPTFFRNDGGRFVDATRASGVDSNSGWWNSISAGDLDNDGDVDYVLGNLGLNTQVPLRASRKWPLRLYASDFDANGSLDLVMSYYYRGIEYPLRNRDDAASQMPVLIRRKFPTFTGYASAALDQIYPRAKLDSAMQFQATDFASCWMENLGGGRFALHQLPLLAQITPIFGSVVEDFNGDGNLDLLAIGNFFGPDAEVVRYDAGYGLLLLGDGKGGFTMAPTSTSGFRAPNDGRALACLRSGERSALAVVANNNAVMQTFSLNLSRGSMLVVDPKDRYTSVTLTFRDGRIRRQELYDGSGYLSQSSPMIVVPPDVTKVTFFRGATNVREITP